MAYEKSMANVMRAAAVPMTGRRPSRGTPGFFYLTVSVAFSSLAQL